MASDKAYVCVRTRDWAGAVAAVEEDPTTAQYRDENGSLSLHWITAARGAPDFARNAMLTAYPLGAQEKNKWGRLPLHWAVLNNNIPAVEALLSVFPKALLERDRRGECPMDIAQSKNLDAVAAVLVEAERVMTVRRGWAILKSLTWTLMLHSRAVVRANHPDVLFAQGYFNVLD